MEEGVFVGGVDAEVVSRGTRRGVEIRTRGLRRGDLRS
jgi:hypothetical protein